MALKRYCMIDFILVCAIIVLSVMIFQKRLDAVEADAKGNAQQKVCFLTFDDGPGKNTDEILDILKRYDVKATFFLIGAEIREENRTQIERIKKEGHGIGLHSNVHDFNKLYKNVEGCIQDFESQYNTLKKDYGIDTKIFRFPGGSACSYMHENRQDFIEAMKEKGFICFDWHVSGEDSYGKPTAWSIQKNIFDNLEKYEKPIILLHDMNIADATVEALPGILEHMIQKGYVFRTLENETEYIYR